jgi:hypothetical protein
VKESTVYQAILEEGQVEAARRILLLVGQDRFGNSPTRKQRSALDAITNPDRLEDLVVRAGHVASWSELLAAPVPRRRKKS